MQMLTRFSWWFSQLHARNFRLALFPFPLLDQTKIFVEQSGTDEEQQEVPTQGSTHQAKLLINSYILLFPQIPIIWSVWKRCCSSAPGQMASPSPGSRNSGKLKKIGNFNTVQLTVQPEISGWLYFRFPFGSNENFCGTIRNKRFSLFPARSVGLRPILIDIWSPHK